MTGATPWPHDSAIQAQAHELALAIVANERRPKVREGLVSQLFHLRHAGVVLAAGTAGDAVPKSGPTRRGALTPIEWQVLRLLCDGVQTNAALAARLGLPEGAIQQHVTAVCHELGTSYRARAVRLAYHQEFGTPALGAAA